MLLGICFSLHLHAQALITGKVIDGENGEALLGATIVERGTSNGTLSDLDGRFSLQLSRANPVLVFSFLGYKSIEQSYAGETDLQITLYPNTELLDEIVVTALNLERSTKGLGYVVQQLDATEISDVKSPNFVDNLAGRAAGVSVSQGATGLGSTSKISIRGEASFTNNNPLFVVDGVPINNESNLNFTNAAASGFQEVDFGNGGMEINADDVAKVSVLKGPAAAALYGTRAANGVILVKTKDGAMRRGLGISFNSSTFVDRPFQLPEFQNSYGQGNSGDFEFVDGLGGGTNDNITYSWGPALDQGEQIAQFDSPVALPDGSTVRGADVAVHGGAEISPSNFESHPDNLKDFYNTGLTSINNIALASGFDQGHFRISLTDLRSKSYIPGVNLDRNTVSARLQFRPLEALQINAGGNYINSRSDNRPSNGYGSENINYSLVAWGPRSLNTASLEDYWQPGLEGIQQYSFNYTFFDNPYFILEENRNAFNRDRLFGHLSAQYQITERLSLLLGTGMDYSDESREFLRHFSTNRFRQGAYAEQDVFYREINSHLLLNYQQSHADLKFDFSLGANRMDQNAAERQTETLSLAQPGIFNFSNAASPINVYQYDGKKRINSIYGLAKLSYRSFLFLDITGRNDWSSALATPDNADNASFFYPSASLSYVLSSMMDLPSSISFAKLRASWSQVGNDTAPFQTSSAFVAGTPYQSQPSFSNQDLIANSNLEPERTTAMEFGTDLRFWDDRVRFDLSYYNALTENQIISFPVPISSGYTEQVVNGGSVRSKGLEILARIDWVRKRKLGWNTYFNFSTNKSTVEALPAGADKITLAFSRVYDNVNQTVWYQVEEGGQIGDMYGTGYLKNENGDFVIGSDGKFIADNTLKKLGNYNPDFTLGFGTELRLGNWNINFLLDWRPGGELVSRTLSLAGVAGQLKETEDREGGVVAEGVINVGEPDAPVWEENTLVIPAETYYRQYYDRNHEENNIYDASYLKIRQVSIAYTFGSAAGKGYFRDGRSLEIAIIGRNLFAFSQIPHFDPEQLAVQGNQFVSGVEDMSYPSSRSIGFKLGLNF